MNLFEHIKSVLEQKEDFCKDGKIFKNKVVESALKLDPVLLSLLLKDERTKKTFFEEVEGFLVFDKVKFQKFVSNKEFLPDSFTAFKNKIGLTANGEYLTEANEVVLDFPFKDCVLEGGQTKEDQKRQEIFWNETLAPDEIDRMFEPKVFTNWKKYDIDGEHEVTDISADDNFIIKGNNLIVLHSLKKVYKGKIKLIYIDPPYNTGNDGFGYNDSFNHSTWLTFMKNRLEAAWELLSNDGAFFIQVDDGEFSYLKLLCDEIFGRENLKETIVLKSSTESGVNAINVKRGERLFKVKEYILFYTKSPAFRFKPFFTKAEYNYNYKYLVNKEGDKYTISDISKIFKEKYSNKLLSNKEIEVISKSAFSEFALNNSENIYSLEKNIKKAGEKFKKFALENKKKGIVEEYINSSNEKVLVFDGGSLVPLKDRVIIEDGTKYFGVLASDLWVDIGTTSSNEGNVSFPNGKKPEKLLRRIIEMTTSKNDIVLDYHLGSGTTCAVAHKLGRRYIGIEQLDYGENDSVIRLRNVINGEQTGVSKVVGWFGGGSFVRTELLNPSEEIISKIQKSTSKDELISIISIINSNNIGLYKLNFEINNQNDIKQIELDELKKIAISSIDKNCIYVSTSEMSDVTLKVSNRDQNLNNKFYNI